MAEECLRGKTQEKAFMVQQYKITFLAAVHIVTTVFVWDSSAYPYYINLKILNEVQHFAGWLFLKMSTESLRQEAENSAAGGGQRRLVG